jgi:general secretion pathway protein J
LVCIDMTIVAVPAKGFTLLEVLIAIFITAAIGLGSWQVLNQAIRTNELTQTRLAELGDLQKMMFFLSRDIQQIAPRGIRDSFGDYQPALSTNEESFLVEFTRVGWRNPLNDERSELQRVAYVLNPDGELERHTWAVLDRAQDSETKARTLMSGLSEVKVSFLDDKGKWQDEWPPAVGSASSDPMSEFNILPVAINIVVNSDRFGEMNRVYDLASYLEQKSMPGAAGAGGSGSGAGGTGSDTSDSGVDDESVEGVSEELSR